jgi:hypothetical protein
MKNDINDGFDWSRNDINISPNQKGPIMDAMFQNFHYLFSSKIKTLSIIKDFSNFKKSLETRSRGY